jgi:hypothetical protein
MDKVKLFEEYVDEAKALSIDKLVKMIGDKPTVDELARFVYQNYDKVTGLKKSMRDEEMEFPTEIEDLANHFGFDVFDDEFMYSYQAAAESVVTEATLSSEQKKVERFLNNIAKEFGYSLEDAIMFVKDTISKIEGK